MKKKLHLIAAIIISLTSSNAHAMESDLLIEADARQAQTGGNYRRVNPDVFSNDDIFCIIMSFLNIQEASNMAATSRSNWKIYEHRFPGLKLSPRIGLNDYVERFKGRKMFSHDHPFVSERFVQEMFKRYPTLKDPSVLQTVKGFFKKQLAKENPDLDTLTQIITRHYSVFCTIMDEQHIEGFDKIEPQLRPYMDLYAQLKSNVNTPNQDLRSIVTYLQENQRDLKAFGYMMIAQDSTVNGYERIDAAEYLAELGGEYKPQIAQAWLAIARAANAGFSDRVDAAEALANLGGAYKPEIAQILCTIGIASGNCYSRVRALKILAKLGGAYKPQMAQIFLAIAQNAAERVEDRRDAARSLVKLDEGAYKPQMAQIFFAIAQDAPDSRDRVCAARFLAELGGDYTNQAITALQTMEQTWGVIKLLKTLRETNH